MASKGLILFCFLLALHKNFLELQCPGSEPVEQEPTEGLGLGSVIRSLRHSGFMGLNLITRPKRQPTKGNNALYLALLLLCAGDIETNPGPTNIITCLIILLFLYITLDGCGWSSSFSLAVPVMVFSRESNINGGGSGDSGGGNDDSEGDDLVAKVVPPTIIAAIITATGTITAAIIAKVTKCKCCSRKKLASSSDDGNPVDACAKELKDFYEAQNQSNYNAAEDQWPPPSHVADIHKFIRLAMIRAEDKIRQGQPDDSPKRKRKIDERVDKPYKEKDSIELENIFTVEDQTIKKVLVEGAPGSGKSTLSLHICHQWAVGKLFKEFKLVILVRLRDPNVHKAKVIADLLPKGKWWTEATANKIINDNGQEVLFVLDGWDELPKQHQHWFRGFIGPGSKLPGSSFVITSRPVSSIVLQEFVLSRIEILGFDRENLRKYFKSVLKKESRADNLIKTISRKPMIEGSCYLPLNASILVYLYKHNREYKLPDTQYEIFKKLVCNCITRHLWKMEPSDNFTCHCRKKTNHTRINSLDELSGKDKDVFEWLCEIAYKGIMEDKVTFELEPGINTLGLLEGVESLVDSTKSFSYNFLHLSIQELLAAIHMATKLTDEEQTEQFKTLFGKEDRFAAVFQFFAAETKLINPGIGEVVKEVARSKDHSLLLHLMHCLFEAQDPKLYQLVVGELKSSLDLSISNVRLKSWIDCYFLGDFLTHCNDFKVDLTKCHIGDESCKALFGRREGKDYHFPIQRLTLDFNYIGDEGAKVLSDAIKKMANLETLSLYGNSISDEGAKVLSDAIKTMANLKELDLYGNPTITDEGRRVLREAAKGKGINVGV